VLTQTRQFKHTLTLKSLRILKKLRHLRLTNAALVDIEQGFPNWGTLAYLKGYI